MSWFLSWHSKMLFLRAFILKPTERGLVLQKNGTCDFENSPPFERFFLWKSIKVSNVFNTLTLKQIFWKRKTFFKQLEYRSLVEATKIENNHFHSKLLCQKPMLRQKVWRLKNGPITKSGVLPVTFASNCPNSSTCKLLLML